MGYNNFLMNAEAKSRFRDYQGNTFFHLLILAFRNATRILPLWFMRFAALFICAFFILFNLQNYRAVILNIRTIFPGKGLFSSAALAYRVFLKYSFYLIDLFFISHGRERLGKFKINYRGEEILSEAIRSGKGIIFLTLHMGNWEIGGLTLAERGLKPPVIAYFPDSQGIIEGQRTRLRNLAHTNHVELREGEFSAVKFLRILQEGGTVAIQGDRLQHDRGIDMEMFGHKASFPRGPILLASAANAIILPVFMVMKGYNTYAITVEKPLVVKAYPATEETVRRNLDEIIGIFEKYIEKYPDQWYTFMPFWNKDKDKVCL
jgi:KDO2-lipid IV(A) lauroyltransferase